MAVKLRDLSPLNADQRVYLIGATNLRAVRIGKGPWQLSATADGLLPCRATIRWMIANRLADVGGRSRGWPTLTSLLRSVQAAIALNPAPQADDVDLPPLRRLAAGGYECAGVRITRNPSPAGGRARWRLQGPVFKQPYYEPTLHACRRRAAMIGDMAAFLALSTRRAQGTGEKRR